jgi:ABC-type multidrug transport system permease subunit
VSFVRDERVPQMAGAEEVVAALQRAPSISYAGLVLNRVGLERLCRTALDRANVTFAATDAFNRQNGNMSLADAIAFAEQVKGRWREFRREPSAFFFVILMPVLWMAILGFAFSGSTKPVYQVAYVGPGASTARAALAQSPEITLKTVTSAEAAQLLLKGDVVLIVAEDPAGVHFRYDAANKASVAARQVANDAVQRGAGRVDPVAAHDELITVPGTRYIDFLVPGLIGLSIMTTSLFGTGLTIVVNRRENLLKRYLATPMRPGHYIGSHIVGRGIILAVELTAILAAAFAMFRFVPVGHLWDLVAFAALGTAAFGALSVLCGSRTSNAATMNGLTNLISLPMMILSGVWFSRGNFPDWMAAPASFLPLSALVDGLRRIALEGGSLASVTREASILLVYAIAAGVAAKSLFKWY